MTKRTLATAAVAVALLGLTGCNGGKAPDSADTPSQDQIQKFIKCMQDHGVDVPEPGGDGGIQLGPAPGSNAKMDAAHAACAKYAPSDGGESEDISEAEQELALKKAECLRKQGIDAKDPKPGSTIITVEEGSDSPDKLVQAYTVCNKQFASTPSN